MGFALWTNAGLAWAAGTSEYRAMGAAVVSDTDLFRAADFRPNRRPPVSSLTFEGHFASLGQVNDFLVKARMGWRGRPRPLGRESSRPSKSRLDSRLCKPGGLRHGRRPGGLPHYNGYSLL